MYILRDAKPFSCESPRVIAPICERSPKELIKAAKAAAKEADMIEWRADFFALRSYTDTLAEIRKIIPDMPLIFTLRARDEGGVLDIDENERLSLIETAARSGLADFTDIELSCGTRAISIIKESASKETRLIVSCHDFDATPSEGAILTILRAELEAGADCAKIAVTPKNPADVLTLLSASEKFRAESTIPFIAISMGTLGIVSRAFGHVFGSAATFMTKDQEIKVKR